MRAFVAIDLPEEVSGALERLQAVLPVGRPVPPENLHLTLAFLGEQPEDALEELNFELEAIRQPPFELRFDGLGAFGGDRPRVLFADVAPNPALSGLRRRVVKALRRAGIAPSKERFHPHVTLARFGERAAPEVAARLRRFVAETSADTVPGFPVTGFGLYASTLRPTGARHELLARYEFV